MKSLSIISNNKYFVVLFILICLTNKINSLSSALELSLQSSTDSKQKSKEKDLKEDISDSELDAMLKDPKYAYLLNDSAADLLKASPDSSSKPTKEPEKSEKHKSASSTPTSSVSETPKTESSSHLRKGRERESREKTIDELSLDSLNLKDLKDLDSNLLSSSKLQDLSSSTPKKKEDPLEEKFQSYDFLTKQQARFLIEILKQPVFFNMLPPQAQQIVKVTKDNFQFKMTEDGKIDDFIDANMLNSPNSQSFIDPDGQISRKGTLTLIDPINSKSKFVWTVSNSKTLTFYESQSYLVIVKLYRNSSLILKDIPSTPCFLISNGLSPKEGSMLVCSTSVQEKEVWIQTISSASEKYKVVNNGFLQNK